MRTHDEDHPRPSRAEERAIDLASLMPFAVRCGVEITHATPARVMGELAWASDLTTAGGGLHGGALVTLADSVGAACAHLNLPGGTTTATSESHTHFLRPLRSGRARAVAEPIHVGRTRILVQTEVRDDDGKLVALVTQSQAVVPAPVR